MDIRYGQTVNIEDRVSLRCANGLNKKTNCPGLEQLVVVKNVHNGCWIRCFFGQRCKLNFYMRVAPGELNQAKTVVEDHGSYDYATQVSRGTSSYVIISELLDIELPTTLVVDTTQYVTTDYFKMDGTTHPRSTSYMTQTSNEFVEDTETGSQLASTKQPTSDNPTTRISTKSGQQTTLVETTTHSLEFLSTSSFFNEFQWMRHIKQILPVVGTAAILIVCLVLVLVVCS
ncbi:hypothetical protein BSL78_00510 [Apostichopus japonicus]|uniref:Uncharacterized protein n=1 Tax=Stichopus japonicus TaxID=307972 RepID=A0A2G8LQW1_STIJA|nr:hypothetical protein BSL78_00510 [Apostichopus japonicus]